MKRLLALVFCLLMAASTALANTYKPLSWKRERSPFVPKQENYLPDLSGYHDGSLDIRIEHITYAEIPVTLAYVQLVDPTQFRTALVGKFPSKQMQRIYNITPRLNAVLAINGDWFIGHNDGIVYRNGVRLRFRPNSGRDTLIIDQNGDLRILKPTPSFGWHGEAEAEVWWENYLAETGIKPIHVFCFGPGLIVDGQLYEDFSDCHLDVAPAYPNKRLGIGQLGPLNYVIAMCEGPEVGERRGITMPDLARLFYELGCYNAYNLDGGNSANIVLNNTKLARQSREIPDIIWFATLER